MDFLKKVMSRENAHKYVDIMACEIQNFSFLANFYHPSQYATIRRLNPKACHMVSHNKKWVYIFHKENQTVVVDRIRPSKLIVR